MALGVAGNYGCHRVETRPGTQSAKKKVQTDKARERTERGRDRERQRQRERAKIIFLGHLTRRNKHFTAVTRKWHFKAGNGDRLSQDTERTLLPS